MTRWFRFYADVVNDPKVQRLPPDRFKSWVNLLCLAAQNNGRLPPEPDIAFALRITESKVVNLLNFMRDAGLLDRTENGGWQPHNWASRQFKSDVSNERVKRFRERQRNVTETADETPPDTDTEADTEQNREGERRADAPDPCAEAFALWNEMAGRVGLPLAQALTDTRKRALRARLKEAGGLEGWRFALAKVEGSKFFHGENDRRWRADLDFVLQAKSFTRLMEGSYDRGKSRREMTQETLRGMYEGALS